MSSPPDDTPPRRVVLCIGDTCKSGQSEAHYNRLCDILGAPNPFNPRYPAVKWTVANCLDRCEQAPNLVIYPEGIWCHYLDDAKLEQIIRDEILPRIDNPAP